MNEKSLERKLKREIERRGGVCWKFTSPGTAGVPDRVCIMPGGRVLFVELKGDDGRLQPIQAARIQQMRELGADVRVLRGDLEEISDVLQTPPISKIRD